MVSEEDRHAVVSFYKKGWKNCKISSTLKLKKYEVSRVLKRYKETGSVEDRPRSGKLVTARTKAMKNRIRCRVKRNPEQSLGKMAQELNISDRTVRRIVKEDLKLVSYKKITAHVLTDKMKEKRLENCKRMLAVVASRGCQKNLFSDEKLFNLEPVHNRQNDRVLLPKGSPRAVNIKRSHFSKDSVMVWAGITAKAKTKLYNNKGVCYS
ncbi:hypothetical protein L596_020984 [Steinernema carpocapsae]|uniref:Uncharacterized protein n=1 Tax=Steinernema carpocapsae TaxID=34508 RepID=A0A4U5MVD2_STECR|nr:hypothetical protein L596_020984 [Steinernema carpocapsae]